jgi:hypothetical protein
MEAHFGVPFSRGRLCTTALPGFASDVISSFLGDTGRGLILQSRSLLAFSPLSDSLMASQFLTGPILMIVYRRYMDGYPLPGDFVVPLKQQNHPDAKIYIHPGINLIYLHYYLRGPVFPFMVMSVSTSKYLLHRIMQR